MSTTRPVRVHKSGAATPIHGRVTVFSSEPQDWGVFVVLYAQKGLKTRPCDEFPEEKRHFGRVSDVLGRNWMINQPISACNTFVLGLLGHIARLRHRIFGPSSWCHESVGHRSPRHGDRLPLASRMLRRANSALRGLPRRSRPRQRRHFLPYYHSQLTCTVSGNLQFNTKRKLFSVHG
jgi:hypothetical protein